MTSCSCWRRRCLRRAPMSATARARPGGWMERPRRLQGSGSAMQQMLRQRPQVLQMRRARQMSGVRSRQRQKNRLPPQKRGGGAVLAPPAIADVAPGRVPDPTPPPPPPPPVARPADRRRRGREDVEAGWERWVLPDGRGELVYNPIDNSLAAHCHDARHWRCRLNRTCNRLRMRPAQGRPIGQLVAWLFDAARHESREAHFNARREEVVIDWSTRSRARAWFRENCPDSAAAFAKERPMGDDSRDEPIGVPG